MILLREIRHRSEKGTTVRQLFFAILFVGLFVGVTTGQSNRPWTEWPKADAERILKDSPWSQTQVETDTSEMTYTPTAPGRNLGDRNQAGAKNQALFVSYHIRLLSAKPVRQAFGRIIVLSQEKPNPQLVERLQDFIDRDFGDFVVIAVTFEGVDRRLSGPAMQSFNSATSETLKNKTYLELKNGKRLFLKEYISDQSDGLGAKFIFLRASEGRAFITKDDGSVRFYSEISGNIKLNVTYKISEMLYDGKFEY